MQQRVKPWQAAALAILAAALVGLIGWRALQPAPIRSTAPAGNNPTHYEPEMGPAPGLLEDMKKAGQVPPDAIDDGRGHFVSPSRLTPEEREAARRVVELREARRTGGGRR